MKRYNVTNSIWFQCVGIVRVEREFGPVGFFIGDGNGMDQDADEQKIAAWGTEVTEEMFTQFFN